MCTSIAMKTKDFYFGRTLDLECGFGERVVITPRNYPFFFREAGVMLNHYAMIGISSVSDGYPLYAEAANEKGLCMAGLNFPDNAFYSETCKKNKEAIASFELIPRILGTCSTVAEAEKVIETIDIISIPFSSSLPASPLHWHIADSERSITLESVESGLNVYDNPVGVLTNNPVFHFQMTNLSQYLNLTAEYPKDRFGNNSVCPLSPFGQGFGAIGLPGDNSPASRFVRTAFYKNNSVCEDTEASSVTQFFHLLDSVSIVRGSVLTPDGKYDQTIYSCCVNASQGTLYYKTYENSRITAVMMKSEDLNQKKIIEYPLRTEQDFFMQN